MAEINVKVETGQDEFRIENSHIVKAKLTQEPENGKANAELIKELSNILGQKPGIIKGHRSRRKKLKVDMPEEKVEEKLQEATR